MTDQQSTKCPSSIGKPGAQLLGVRQLDGTVAILPEPLPVDEKFIEAASQDSTALEQRFRFTNKCIEGGCTQWTGKACGVIQTLVQHLHEIPAVAELPACAIRPHCRWFKEKAEDACRICTFVVTEVTQEEIEKFSTGITPVEDP